MISKFVEMMKYFAEESVKQSPTGAITRKSKTLLEDYNDLVAKESQARAQERFPWPNVWMNVAKAVAQRSYDPRLQVGCIIIPEDNTGVLSLGYNGNAMGLPNEVESLEPGQSGFIHAEMNALIKCDYNFNKKKHMYVTHVPCPKCSKLIIQGQIARVIYGETYRDTSGIDLLKQAGIEVLSYDEALITHQT